MAQINMASIMSKVRAFAKSEEGKTRCSEYISKCRADGRGTTDGGGTIITTDAMCRAAEMMISILKQTAQEHQLPASVQEHFNSLEYSAPMVVGAEGDTYQIDIWFADNLSRMSLLITTGERKGQYTGDGVANIVSLFDTGYTASQAVYGLWNGHEENGVITSRVHREGKKFMAQAIESFNRTWGELYGVRAMFAVDTEFYSRI